MLLTISLVVACAGKQKPRTIDGAAGSFIVGYGFSIDAQYDPRLDALFPKKYKVLTAAIRNTSLNVIRMDVFKDQWFLVDENGRRHKAVNSLKYKDRIAWKKLGEEMRQHVDYPEMVPISYTATFNLFFPVAVNLKEFREVHYKNADSGLKFRIHKE